MTTLSTADLVLAKLETYDLKQEPSGEYRCNSPFRPGSNSHAFSVKIDGPEYGCYKDFVSDEGGSLYQLAEKLGLRDSAHTAAPNAPSTKRVYTGLVEYAAAHYVPAEAYTEAGWSEGTYTVKATQHPALVIPTATGKRYRLLDVADNAFRSEVGYKRSWYRFGEALDDAREHNTPLIFCNGEPSTVAAQWWGVPATCITGGGETTIPDDLLKELTLCWDGPIIVALDCDDKGRKAAPALVAQLQADGFDATAVDMKGSNGFDLADFCGLYQNEALAKLLSCLAPETLGTPEHYYETDYGNARRLVAQHGNDLRFVREWGWLAWDGRRWQIDQTGEAERRAKATALSIYQEAADAPDHRRPALARHAIASQSSGKITSMLALAESEREIRATPDDFDANDWLLTCANGTIDLRTGTLKPHDRADMLTKAIDVHYSEQAACPQFLTFLDRIFANNARLIAYVQRMIGYMLSGSTGAQCMFIAHGTGANGKSVLIEVIRALLGDYARNADPSTFMMQQSDRIRSDIARLAGVRFVSSVELDEGRRLSEALVKQVTGGDTLTARFLHKDEFEFMPRFKLLLATNHKPIIRGTDYAIWRRIRMLPFTVTIPEAERDPQLASKLKAELPGILAWAVRGCLDWQRDGLQEPDEVKAATNDYRSEMDVIGQFLDETCTIQPRARVLCAALYSAYAKWCEDGGERPINQRRFGAQMTERGFDRVRTRDGWWYHGIGLYTDRDDGPEAPQTDCDPCDPCDLNSRISTREEFTKEEPGKMDHMDHMDHTPASFVDEPKRRIVVVETDPPTYEVESSTINGGIRVESSHATPAEAVEAIGDASVNLRLNSLDEALYQAGWRGMREGGNYRLLHPDGRRTGLYSSVEAAIREVARSYSDTNGGATP